MIVSTLACVATDLLGDPDSAMMTMFASILQAVPFKYRNVLDKFIVDVLTEDWCYGRYVPSASSSTAFDTHGKSYPRVLSALVHAVWLPDKWQLEFMPKTMLELSHCLPKATSLQQVKFLVHCFGPFTPQFALEPGNSTGTLLEVLDNLCAIPEELLSPVSATTCRAAFDVDGARSLLTYVRLFIAGIGESAQRHKRAQDFLERADAYMELR